MATQCLLRGMTIDDVYRNLIAHDYSDRTAARIVTFLPSAFARVHYSGSGYTFPNQFFDGTESYKAGRASSYSSEPIFAEAMRLAEQMRRDGDWAQVLSIVEISAEHRGIAEARAKGLTPTGSSAIIYNF